MTRASEYSQRDSSTKGRSWICLKCSESTSKSHRIRSRRWIRESGSKKLYFNYKNRSDSRRKSWIRSSYSLLDEFLRSSLYFYMLQLRSFLFVIFTHFIFISISYEVLFRRNMLNFEFSNGSLKSILENMIFLIII